MTFDIWFHYTLCNQTTAYTYTVSSRVCF